jgi:hypothetical protein
MRSGRTRPPERGQQSLRIPRRAEQVSRFQKAFQLIGGDHRHRATGSATHQDHLAVVDRAIHQ